MGVIRWNPWTLQDFLESTWDVPTIPGISRLIGQGLNIYETDEEIVAEAALPGVTEDEIDVSIDQGLVRISAKGEQEEEEKSKRKYFMENLSFSYAYAFRLPDIVSDKDPRAELDDGILTLRFPKLQKAPPKKLAVKNKRKRIAKESVKPDEEKLKN